MPVAAGLPGTSARGRIRAASAILCSGNPEIHCAAAAPATPIVRKGAWDGRNRGTPAGGDASGAGPGHPVSTERLIYFSDAVIAIAITLLALELPTPAAPVHGNAGVLDFLGEHLTEYIAFLIRFTAVAMHRTAHQRLLRYATGLTGGVLRCNLLW